MSAIPRRKLSVEEYLTVESIAAIISFSKIQVGRPEIGGES
jgi:hypothetical protein